VVSEPWLVPHDCLARGWRADTLPTAHVRCRCGKDYAPRVEPWLAALLVDGQRRRADIEELASSAGLPWPKVTAAASSLGVVNVVRAGSRWWRLAPSRALRTLMAQQVGSGKSPVERYEEAS
jgi:hypothetical protein